MQTRQRKDNDEMKDRETTWSREQTRKKRKLLGNNHVSPISKGFSVLGSRLRLVLVLGFSFLSSNAVLIVEDTKKIPNHISLFPETVNFQELKIFCCDFLHFETQHQRCTWRDFFLEKKCLACKIQNLGDIWAFGGQMGFTWIKLDTPLHCLLCFVFGGGQKNMR